MNDMLSKIELWLFSTADIRNIMWLFLLISTITSALQISTLEKKLHNTRFEMALKGIIPFEEVDK